MYVSGDRVEIGLVLWSEQLYVFGDRQSGKWFGVVECAVVFVLWSEQLYVFGD
jgi:hypothetical protein